MTLVQYTFNLAGRPLTASAGTPLVSSASYLPFGPVASVAELSDRLPRLLTRSVDALVDFTRAEDDDHAWHIGLGSWRVQEVAPLAR